MKPYTATFRRMSGEEHVVQTDGISNTHANARAWIAFMKTRIFKLAPNHWDLVKLS
jgi:hypothetical protein